MKKWEVVIPTATAEELVTIADAREAACGGHGTAMFDGQDHQHRTGIFGEYALAQMLGAEFDRTVLGRQEAFARGPDGDVNGIEVKATWWSNGGLGVQRKKASRYKPRSQIVLMTLNRTSAGVVCKARGWAYVEEILAQPDSPKFKTYPAPMLEQRELRNMETLVPDA